MSDNVIDGLKTILRLRRRDLDRCEREVAQARAQVAAAQAQEDAATHACSRALSTCEQAVAQQAKQPCDPLVRLHAHATQARAEAARQLRAQARATLEEARQLADQLKREWLRAQARHDAILGELERAMRQWKRQIARRAEDDVPPMPKVALA
ncbi:hypothetical protein [Sphingobium sp. WCS2017Hpa-17]|uniref:hypothetical protein n=1 Tax=Sphingobium sp. WCS2017Hpa-17 TaxID=3073638 RepID=UPI00288B94FD|nr:hypothetical protein [Sphingobium sp. WCS2017Hpa-17]